MFQSFTLPWRSIWRRLSPHQPGQCQHHLGLQPGVLRGHHGAGAARRQCGAAKPLLFQSSNVAGYGVEKRLVPAFALGRTYPLPEDAAPRNHMTGPAPSSCAHLTIRRGAIYPDSIQAFYDLAKASGIALIIDETYKDFRSSPDPLHGLFARPDWQDTFVQLYSFSKVFSMTGYRVGSIIAGSKVLAEARKFWIAWPFARRRSRNGPPCSDWRGGSGEKRAQSTQRSLVGGIRDPGAILPPQLRGAISPTSCIRSPGLPPKPWPCGWLANMTSLCLPGSIFGPETGFLSPACLCKLTG